MFYTRITEISIKAGCFPKEQFQEQYREIRFGDQGQEFKLMPVEDFIKAEGVIPQLQERFKDYLSEKEENNIWTNGKN